MKMRTKWENRPEVTSATIEQFKKDYLDLTNSFLELGAVYNLTSSGITKVAKRLGLPARYGSSAPKVNLDDRIQKLEAELAEAKLQKAKLNLRFEWTGPNELTIHGIGPDFRRLEGLPRLGQFLQQTKGW